MRISAHKPSVEMASTEHAADPRTAVDPLMNDLFVALSTRTVEPVSVICGGTTEDAVKAPTGTAAEKQR